MSKQSYSVLNDNTGVMIFGYYKKLKTLKKKFFVLYNDTPCKAARIEYYDSEKKFKSGFTPKRTIKIKNCFNINRRLYTKHEFVIVLASKDGGFGIVMDTEEEMNTWLNHLLHLQRSGENSLEFPKFEFVWQVIIQKKGIAEQHNIFGSHHICLTSKSVTFIKIGREKNTTDKKITKIEVLLTTIRRCGDSQCFFYMEIGRQCSLGPGELWMETEDALTATNMHEMILSKMVALNEALGEPMRKRSSSATETTNLHHDKKTSQNFDVANNYFFGAQNFCRDRCDSLPSRNRTSSECSSNRIVRITPNTSANRTVNFQVNNSSPIAYSASEESVSVDDSEDSMGVPYLIRSPESVIPEEYSNNAPKLQYIQENIDISSATSTSMGKVIKANIPLIKQCASTKGIDGGKDICGNIEEQSHISSLSHFTGNKWENDIKKEATTNRVRAFSVGSRAKTSRLCSKTSPKLLINNSVDCTTRKSVSVPALTNKNLQSTDQMGDLMEIDFSKSIGKNINRNFHLNRIECQNAFNIQQKKSTFSNSEESIQRNINPSENGYLEMKPITLENNFMALNGNNDVNVSDIQTQQRQNNFEQKADKVDSAADSSEVIHDSKTVSPPTDAASLKENSLHITTEEESNIKSVSPTSSINNLSLSSTCSKNLVPSDELSINKDLYYASLDLPKCGNEVNNRYGFQESSSDSNSEEIKNEYAKINFLQSETTRSLAKNK